jgi:hypothetical protein
LQAKPSALKKSTTISGWLALWIDSTAGKAASVAVRRHTANAIGRVRGLKIVGTPDRKSPIEAGTNNPNSEYCNYSATSIKFHEGDSIADFPTTGSREVKIQGPREPLELIAK